jgi:SET domain-containing protein
MLLVKTFIAASNIHGVGLFAQENIPKGTKVVIFDPEYDLAYDQSEIKKMPLLLQDFIRTYGYKNPERPGHYCCSIDNAKFINHSDAPNLVEMDDGSFATREIDRGEEITTDYRQLDGSEV